MSNNQSVLSDKAKQIVANRIEQHYANKYDGIRYLFVLTAPMDEFVINFSHSGYSRGKFKINFKGMMDHRQELIDTVSNYLPLVYESLRDFEDNNMIINEIFGKVRQDCRMLIEPKGERKSEIGGRRR